MIKTIKVTEQHIKDGKVMQCDKCPVALALLEAFPSLCDANVGLNGLFIGHYVAETPQSVVEFIKVFDSNRSLAKPFTFEADFDLSA